MRASESSTDAVSRTSVGNPSAPIDSAADARKSLCYAENFVYAPPVAKVRRFMERSGGAILDIRAEESHSGSHAAYARTWRTSGGGSLLRLGAHPFEVHPIVSPDKRNKQGFALILGASNGVAAVKRRDPPTRAFCRRILRTDEQDLLAVRTPNRIDRRREIGPNSPRRRSY